MQGRLHSCLKRTRKKQVSDVEQKTLDTLKFVDNSMIITKVNMNSTDLVQLNGSTFEIKHDI